MPSSISGNPSEQLPQDNLLGKTRYDIIFYDVRAKLVVWESRSPYNRFSHCYYDNFLGRYQLCSSSNFSFVFLTQQAIIFTIQGKAILTDW